MNRRGFLSGILALGAAPAIVRASSLMPARGLILPPPFHPMSIVFSQDGDMCESWTIDGREFYVGQRWSDDFLKGINIRRPMPYTLNRIGRK